MYISRLNLLYFILASVPFSPLSFIPIFFIVIFKTEKWILQFRNGSIVSPKGALEAWSPGW